MPLFSSLFKMSSIPVELQKPLLDGLALIDSVHGANDSVKLESIPLSRISESSIYTSSHTGSPGLTLGVNIGLDSPHPLYDIVHESGHVFDRSILARTGKWDTLESTLLAPTLKPILDAIHSSIAYKNLVSKAEELLNYRSLLDPDIYNLFKQQNGMTEVIQKNVFLIGHLDYGLKPAELFARAYAQTIASITADHSLKSDIEKYAALQDQIVTGFVWEADDFALILDQMQSLLKNFPPVSPIE